MGHLTATVETDGVITMSYKQTNKEGNLMTEICTKTPKVSLLVKFACVNLGNGQVAIDRKEILFLKKFSY